MNNNKNSEINTEKTISAEAKAKFETTNQVKYGEDAFAYLVPLSEAVFQISTPTGKTIKCTSKYVGKHSKHLLLFEMPKVSQNEVKNFFQRGYLIKACVISSEGEGEKIYFKSKVEYVINSGELGLFIISLPSSTQIAGGLREEARLRISLNGMINPSCKQLPCIIKDISGKGCLLQVQCNYETLSIDQNIELIITEGFESDNFQATIRNKSKKKSFWNYGILFEEKSQRKFSKLYENLEFCRETQTFSLTSN